MKRLLTRLSRRLGFEVVSYPGGKLHWRQLVQVLERARIDTVLDIGANIGQYAQSLRRAGYRQRIVSFEPLPEPNAYLHTVAQGDPAWQIAAPVALGAAAGEVSLNVSAESEMSSVLPFTPAMEKALTSSAMLRQEVVRQVTLDAVWEEHVGQLDRVLLKLDVQGSEPAVLDGAKGCLEKIRGVQIEMSLRTIYQGEVHYLQMMERIEDLGFQPHLILPGYFSRHERRMWQFDAVFMRPGADGDLGGATGAGANRENAK